MTQGRSNLRNARHGPGTRRPRIGRRTPSWKQTILLALVLAGSFLVSVGEDNRAAFAEALRDPLSILAQRSPGERGAGTLRQTKPARTRVAAAAPFAPSERVLPAMRMRPPVLPFIDAPGLEPITPPIYAPPGLESAGPAISAPVFAVPAISGITPAGFGDGDITPPPTNIITPPAAPPSAVPEPETWLTMILGFFVAGQALRRRRTTGATQEGRRDQIPTGRT